MFVRRIERTIKLVKSARNIITLTKEERTTEVQVEELLDSINKGALPRTVATYAQVLNACSKIKALELGRRAHRELQESGLEDELALGNHIVNMYAKCGGLAEARAFFDRLGPERKNVFTWTAVMTAYAQTGHCIETMKLLKMMLLDGVRLDRVLLVTVLESCSDFDDLREGEMIHELAVESGLVSQDIVCNALINMYGKCGSPESALRTFDSLESPTSVISWTSVIEAQSQNCLGEQALRLFRRMQLLGVKPNLVTFAVVLKACDSIKFLHDARLLHDLVTENCFDENSIVGAVLVHTYVLCTSLDDARETFESLKRKSVIAWTTMIQAYAVKGLSMEAFYLYRSMVQEGVQPDKVSYLFLLGACQRPADLEDGRRIHSQIAGGEIEMDVAVQNSLVTMYGRCGDLKSAHREFSKIQHADEISWNAMFGAYGSNGHPDRAFALFREFLLSGLKPSRPTFLTVLTLCENLQDANTLHQNVVESGLESEFTVQTALISCYGKCESVADSKPIFDSMKVWNHASYNAMMGAFSRQGESSKAMELLRTMLGAGVKPTEATFLTALNACALAGDLVQGRHLHSLIDQAKQLETNPVLGNALALMYAKCGRLEEARQVFSRVWSHDVVSWTGIIESHARYGLGDAAMLLFYKMQQDGRRPNNISFTCILTACSHAGLVHQGCEIFESLVRDHGIRPSEINFGSAVDLLARAGRLDVAEKFVDRLPSQAQDEGNLKMVLLGACRNQGDVERGKRTASSLFSQHPSSNSGYVLLSNLFAGDS